ncbi:MAG: SAM-dependent methyltransferase [Aggregatilineales bacterium]
MSKELGDFQTPLPLVKAILTYLQTQDCLGSRVLEPTCGKGNFIRGLLSLDIPPREIQGIELQSSYVVSARSVAEGISQEVSRVLIHQQSIFDFDLVRDLQWEDKGRLLIVGNPPWVTNTELATLESDNVPQKTNLKGLKGIDALTGGSNFDIAEYIWLKLLMELSSEHPIVAMLCKTIVARNVLHFASSKQLPITKAVIRRINAKKWFNAAVDACLFHVELGVGTPCYETPVYADLYTEQPQVSVTVKNGQLISDTVRHEEVDFIEGESSLTWRQGIKHDAAPVMELTYQRDGSLINKLGECVEVEADYVFPLLKSSDLYNGKRPRKAIIVTQHYVGEDTKRIAEIAPRLWAYLKAHESHFLQRKSSIYVDKPSFSIFGIGDYSFYPYKVAVAGLYKSVKFSALGPVDERPIMLDDTCYFVACFSAQQAAFLAALLEEPLCKKFIAAVIFTDAKRPVTKKLLQRIDLLALVRHSNLDHVFDRANTELRKISPSSSELLDQSLAERYVETETTIDVEVPHRTLANVDEDIPNQLRLL